VPDEVTCCLYSCCCDYCSCNNHCCLYSCCCDNIPPFLLFFI
jgi:hypothetical protein